MRFKAIALALLLTACVPAKDLAPVPKEGVTSFGGRIIDPVNTTLIGQGNTLIGQGNSVLPNHGAVPNEKANPLIGGDGASIVAGGGGNITVPGGAFGNGDSGSAATIVDPRDVPPKATKDAASLSRAIAGHVSAQLGTPTSLPVTGAKIVAYHVGGTEIAVDSQPTDAQGAFRLTFTEADQLLVLRCQFTTGGKEIYLGALVADPAEPTDVRLDAVSTLIEARFLQRCGGYLPPKGLLSADYLTAFHKAVTAVNPQIAPEVLAPSANLDARVAAYEALGKAYPAAFTSGIDQLPWPTAPTPESPPPTRATVL